MVAIMALQSGSKCFASFENSTVFVDVANIGANVHDHLIQHVAKGLRVGRTEVRPRDGSKTTWEFASVVLTPNGKGIVATGLVMRCVDMDIDRLLSRFNEVNHA